MPVQGVGAPLLPSSETSTARLCLGFEGDVDALIGWCMQALDEHGVGDRDLERIHNNLGYLHDENGDYAKAKAAYRAALALNPLSADALNGLGWVFWALDDYDNAIAHFTEAMGIDPAPSSLGGLASSLRFSGGDLDRARELLEQALLIEPAYIWGLRELGWVHWQLDDTAAATRQFNRALEIDPDDPWALYGLAFMQTVQGEPDKALENVNRALGATEAVDLLSLRAYIMNDRGNYRQAISDATRALELAPGDPDAARHKASAHWSMGHLSLAIQTFERAAEEGATGALFLADYADAVFARGDADRALDLVTQSLAIDDSRQWIHNLHASVLIDLDRPEDALAAAERGVAIDAGNWYSHIKVAYARVALNDMDGALEAARTARIHEVPDDEVNDLVRYILGEGHVAAAFRFRAELYEQTEARQTE